MTVSVLIIMGIHITRRRTLVHTQEQTNIKSNYVSNLICCMTTDISNHGPVGRIIYISARGFIISKRATNNIYYYVAIYYVSD